MHQNSDLTEKGGDEPPTRGGGRNPEVSFHGERRTNQTHVSRTDPDARLAKIKGKEAKLAYRGHLLVENRHGLIVDCALTKATSTAEQEAALVLLTRERARHRGPMTVGADKGYNTKTFVSESRKSKITPHVAEKKRYNAIDQRTTGWEGYAVSQRRRKIVEEPFGSDEGDRGSAQAPASGRGEGACSVHAYLRLLQPGATEEPGGEAVSGVRMRGDMGPRGAAGGVPRGRIVSNGAPPGSFQSFSSIGSRWCESFSAPC